MNPILEIETNKRIGNKIIMRRIKKTVPFEMKI